MQSRLFVLMAVSKEPINQMDDKIGGAAMTRMLGRDCVLLQPDDALSVEDLLIHTDGIAEELVARVVAALGRSG